MTFLTELDTIIATATRTFFAILGIWGVVRAIRGLGVDGSYLGAVAIGTILYVVSLIFDITLFFGGIMPDRPGLHYLYAVFAALLMPFIYGSVVKGDDSNTAQWIWAFVTVFLWGIAVRLAGI